MAAQAQIDIPAKQAGEIDQPEQLPEKIFDRVGRDAHGRNGRRQGCKKSDRRFKNSLPLNYGGIAGSVKIRFG
jgi:hypothetical protein